MKPNERRAELQYEGFCGFSFCKPEVSAGVVMVTQVLGLPCIGRKTKNHHEPHIDRRNTSLIIISLWCGARARGGLICARSDGGLLSRVHSSTPHAGSLSCSALHDAGLTVVGGFPHAAVFADRADLDGSCEQRQRGRGSSAGAL